MPLQKLARQLGLPEMEILDVRSGPSGLTLVAEKKRAPFEACPRCATLSRAVYDHRWISVRDEPVRQAQITLRLRKRRYSCPSCRKPFTEFVPGIWPGRRTTQRLREAVMHACQNFSSLSDVRETFKLSSSFVYKVCYEQLEIKNRQITPVWPRCLGVDEHFVRRRLGTPEFMTVFTDLKRRSVRECVHGKTKAGLIEKTRHMAGRHDVEWIAIDMSDTYRGFCLEHFPKARIVADKFHVLRVFSGILNRHRIDATGDVRKNPVRKLLLRNRDRLKHYERNALDLWLKDHPKILEAYEWKERFHRLYRIKGHERSKNRLEKLLLAMRFSLIPEIKRFGRTLERWKDEILNYFLCRLTNAVTEGFNRIASLVKNRAFGYRNTNNYRLRFLNACAF